MEQVTHLFKRRQDSLMVWYCCEGLNCVQERFFYVTHQDRIVSFWTYSLLDFMLIAVCEANILLETQY